VIASVAGDPGRQSKRPDARRISDASVTALAAPWREARRRDSMAAVAETALVTGASGFIRSIEGER